MLEPVTLEDDNFRVFLHLRSKRHKINGVVPLFSGKFFVIFLQYSKGKRLMEANRKYQELERPVKIAGR